MDKLDVYIIPRKGLIVRDPKSFSPLGEAGEYRTLIGPSGRYWRRRIACGDVMVGEPPKAPAQPTNKFVRTSNKSEGE